MINKIIKWADGYRILVTRKKKELTMAPSGKVIFIEMALLLAD